MLCLTSVYLRHIFFSFELQCELSEHLLFLFISGYCIPSSHRSQQVKGRLVISVTCYFGLPVCMFAITKICKIDIALLYLLMQGTCLL